MKSKLLYLMMFAVAVISLPGCDDESTAGMTRITYYPELTLEGDATLYLDKGTAFGEPGYSALLNGEDVTSQVKVSSNVDTNKSGVYSVSYSITNADGFAVNATRTVIVTDPVDAVEGVYDVDANSYRDYNGTVVPYGARYAILILNNGDGTYSVDDLLGGWYCQRAGYGEAYAMQGKISIAADGSITMIDSFLAGWGDSATSMTDATFDAATGTIKWNVEYTTTPMNFYVTMYKRQ